MIDYLDEVIEQYPEAVKQAKKEMGYVNYLTGLVMKKTKGRAEGKKVKELVWKEVGKNE